jgi:hypothetical protein
LKLEQQLGITERWTADLPEYLDVTHFIQHCKYLRAVDTLEALVVQCLFELTKMNHSRTGMPKMSCYLPFTYEYHLLPAYKLHMQIAKALQTQSHAIQTALTNYNIAQDPPQPTLDFKEVIEYSSLTEFDILWNTHGSVQSCIWTQPSYQAAMAYYFKMKCACEEIKQLNVEITRLQTFVHDDGILHSQAIKTFQTTDPGLMTVMSHQ